MSYQDKDFSSMLGRNPLRVWAASSGVDLSGRSSPVTKKNLHVQSAPGNLPQQCFKAPQTRG